MSIYGNLKESGEIKFKNQTSVNEHLLEENDQFIEYKDFTECTDLLLEYSGNPTRNQEFKELLDELKDLLGYFNDLVEYLIYNLSSYKMDCKKVADKKNASLDDIKSLNDKIDQIYERFEKWKKDQKTKRKIDGQITWKNFRSKTKTFNSKYSEIVMEDKKKLVRELEKTINHLYKLSEPWAKDGKEIEELFKILTNLKAINQIYGERIYKEVNAMYTLMINETNYTIGDIKYVIRTLNIEKESSVLYKIINKLFK